MTQYKTQKKSTGEKKITANARYLDEDKAKRRICRQQKPPRKPDGRTGKQITAENLETEDTQAKAHQDTREPDTIEQQLEEMMDLEKEETTNRTPGKRDNRSSTSDENNNNRDNGSKNKAPQKRKPTTEDNAVGAMQKRPDRNKKNDRKSRQTTDTTSRAV